MIFFKELCCMELVSYRMFPRKAGNSIAIIRFFIVKRL
jgi:hypothetical protein